jgi:hypothetical protein
MALNFRETQLCATEDLSLPTTSDGHHAIGTTNTWRCRTSRRWLYRGIFQQIDCWYHNIRLVVHDFDTWNDIPNVRMRFCQLPATSSLVTVVRFLSSSSEIVVSSLPDHQVKVRRNLRVFVYCARMLDSILNALTWHVKRQSDDLICSGLHRLQPPNPYFIMECPNPLCDPISMPEYVCAKKGAVNEDRN